MSPPDEILVARMGSHEQSDAAAVRMTDNCYGAVHIRFDQLCNAFGVFGYTPADIWRWSLAVARQIGIYDKRNRSSSNRASGRISSAELPQPWSSKICSVASGPDFSKCNSLVIVVFVILCDAACQVEQNHRSIGAHS